MRAAPGQFSANIFATSSPGLGVQMMSPTWAVDAIQSETRLDRLIINAGGRSANTASSPCDQYGTKWVSHDAAAGRGKLV